MFTNDAQFSDLAYYYTKESDRAYVLFHMINQVPLIAQYIFRMLNFRAPADIYPAITTFKN